MPFNPRQQFDAPDWTLLTACEIEGQFFERKAKSDGDKLARAISAFANSNPEGGLIVNGMDDNGTIKGLDESNINALLKELAQRVGCLFDSKTVLVANQEGRDVLLQFIYVPFSEQRVVETSNGKAYRRVGDNTIELRDVEKREMEYQKGQIAFEDEPACPVILDELDSDLLQGLLSVIRKKNHLGSGTNDIQILRNRHLVTYRHGEPYLTYAGLLLLHPDPRWYIPGAYVRFLRYAGRAEQAGSALNLVKDESFEGPIPKIIRDVRAFIKTQIRQFTFRNSEGLFVTDPEYPQGAWYEAVDNALVHRSYSYRNVGIFVRMYDDRLEITSPGDYPLGISPDRFSSHPRNPHLMGAMLW